MAYRLATSCALALALASCGTLPDPGGGGDNLPNAGAGPFRNITTAELGNLRSAPNAIDDADTFVRDPAVLDLDDDPKTFEVAGFFAAALKEEGGEAPTLDTPTNAIVRYEALDARSFDRSAEVVLKAIPEAEADYNTQWEGGVLSAPAVVRKSGEIFLYFAAKGGIGLAKSREGRDFDRVLGAVLKAAESGWDAGAVPTSPGVIRFKDGSLRMFYEVPLGGGASAIGEARSFGGTVWTRIGEGPALAPREAIPGQEEPYDSLAVGSPYPILSATADGRPVLRLYYAARDKAGNAVIGLAARFEDKNGPVFNALPGRFERAVGPVFGTNKPLGPREPCVIAYDGFALLFATATERASATQAKGRPAVAAGIAPATAVLPPPNPP